MRLPQAILALQNYGDGLAQVLHLIPYSFIKQIYYTRFCGFAKKISGVKSGFSANGMIHPRPRASTEEVFVDGFGATAVIVTFYEDVCVGLDRFFAVCHHDGKAGGL